MPRSNGCHGTSGCRSKWAMLTRNERQDVEDAFAIIVAGHANPRSLVTIVFKTEANDVLLQLPVAVSDSKEFASLVVGHTLISRWSSNPPLLDLLLEYLIDTKGR